MKSKLIKTGLVALSLTLASPTAPAPAQEINSLYFTPKLSYSYRMGDMSDAHWNSIGWSTKALGGGEDDDSGFGVGLAVGTDVGFYYDVPVRVEIEYMYRTESEFQNGSRSVRNLTPPPTTLTASQGFKVRAHSLMFNGYYDINTQTDFTPYIGAGLGLAYLDTDYKASTTNGTASSSDQSWNFAWSLGAGVAYHLSDVLALDLGYRYLDLGTGDAGSFRLGGTAAAYAGNASVDYTAHELVLGLRYTGF